MVAQVPMHQHTTGLVILPCLMASQILYSSVPPICTRVDTVWWMIMLVMLNQPRIKINKNTNTFLSLFKIYIELKQPSDTSVSLSKTKKVRKYNNELQFPVHFFQPFSITWFSTQVFHCKFLKEGGNLSTAASRVGRRQRRQADL